MRAKSDGLCNACKSRVILRTRSCFKCGSTDLIRRHCDLCNQVIMLGQDITWDRRSATWEAHTQCWLNSSPEARERVIRKNQVSQIEQRKVEQKKQAETEEKTWQEFDRFDPPEVDQPEVTPKVESVEEMLEEFEEEVKPKKPVVVRKCSSFYDSVYLLIQARIHCYIYGPSGCGKSHIVEQAAHHFGMSFSSISLNVQTMPSSLIGYKDINGVYQSTDFRRIYENGGVFLIDEMDNASGNLLTTLNSTLANRFLQFPDGMITMHPDCVVIATGNTTGRGKTAQYISRQTLDAATLDRFVYLSHSYDERLEMRLAKGENHYEEFTQGSVEYIPCVDATVRETFAIAVQKIRQNALHHGLQTVVSYRPIVLGCKLLNHYTPRLLMEMLILKGCDADTKAKLMEGVY
jgi:AAA domain (dynein-related subfamily)